MTNSTSSNIDIAELSIKAKEERIKDFSELLQSIEEIDDKKKKLWCEIYENAIIDRQNAYVLFVRLVNICGNATGEFEVHGKTIAAFLERMTKSNDQLLKLADLITHSEKASNAIDPNDMFNLINKN